MAAKTIPCGAAPQIQINAASDLSISGWELETIEAQIQNEADLTIEQKDDRFMVFASSDCVFKVPGGASLQIMLAEGSISISSVQGRIDIQSVGGHLNLYATGPVTCGNVSGHCKFSNTSGEIRIRNVGGHLKGSHASMPVTVGNVGGTIKLLDVMLVEKVHAGGNIKVKLPASPVELDAVAGGNIKLWVPVDASFELEAHSGSEKVVFQSRAESMRTTGNRNQITVGAGGPLVRLIAGGSVYILNTGWEDELVFEEFTPAAEALGHEDSISYDDRLQKRIQAKIRRSEARATAASRRAEDRVQAAMRKAESAIPRGIEDILPKVGLGAAGWYGRPQEPPEPRDRVTDQERMIVLTMLSEKKITAEEANQLLDALNGKFGK